MELRERATSTKSVSFPLDDGAPSIGRHSRAQDFTFSKLLGMLSEAHESEVAALRKERESLKARISGCARPAKPAFVQDTIISERQAQINISPYHRRPTVHENDERWPMDDTIQMHFKVSNNFLRPAADETEEVQPLDVGAPTFDPIVEDLPSQSRAPSTFLPLTLRPEQESGPQGAPQFDTGLAEQSSGNLGLRSALKATASEEESGVQGPENSGGIDTDMDEEPASPSPPPTPARSRSNDRGSTFLSFGTDERLNGVINFMHGEKKATTPLGRALESGYCEAIVNVLIVINTAIMAMEMQYKGSQVGKMVKYPGYADSLSDEYPNAERTFQIIEICFLIIFTCELIARLAVFRLQYFRNTFNWLDLFVVCTGFLGQAPGVLPMNATAARLCRLAKLSRSLRLIHNSQMVCSLRLLVMSVSSSFTTLFWALLLITVVQCIAAMFVGHLVMDHLETREDDGQRQLIFSYYGTFTRALLTMFEVCMANWAPACRTLVNHVSEFYTVFFLLYRCVIGFAVLNVINAVFVQQTLKVAQQDQNVMIMQKQRAQEDYTKKLRKLFKKLDLSGDGWITEEEFNSVLSQPAIKTWMTTLEIDSSDMTGLFRLLDDGDGQIDIEEFIIGASRVRGQAKSIDIAILLAIVRRLEQKVDACLNLDPTQSRSGTFSRRVRGFA